MIAHIDVNSFYASCEQVFRPDLWEKPVVVLSNNDGCIIALNAQAKAQGIKMGRPMHEQWEEVRKKKIHVFSSNYALYGDMSQRVMETIATLTPALEVYSIDEAFCEVPEGIQDLDAYGRDVHNRIHQWTGLPVCVGMGPSKALAKVANRMAKSGAGSSPRVCPIDSDVTRKALLQRCDIEDVWGIGRKHAQRLRQRKVTNAWEFTQLSDAWVQKHLTVVGLRLKRELEGTPQLKLEESPAAKKMIGTAKSFGHNLDDPGLMQEALAWYVSEVAQKLREQNRLACRLTVFVETNRFRKDRPQYCNQISQRLPIPTQDSRQLVQVASTMLDHLYRPGFLYKKVGVWASELVVPSFTQLHLFEPPKKQQSSALMGIMDQVNSRYGKAKLRVARSGYRRAEWKLKQEYCSPRFTTQLSEIMTIRGNTVSSKYLSHDS